MDKIYLMINRDSGASIKCSEKYLIPWVTRGFEVQSFIMEDSSQTEASNEGQSKLNEGKSKLQVNLKTTSKPSIGFPLLSSNHLEYTSGSKAIEQESVHEAIEFYRQKSI